jgi:hypothetical protein
MSGTVLGDRFGLSADAVYRHARNHLSPVQRAAILAAQHPTTIDLEALRTSESEGLLGSLVAQRARLQQHGDKALELDDIRGCVSVEAAITANLALTGKLLGQLVTRMDVRHSSVLLTPDYLKLRHTLVMALRPFPDAARAVSAALHRLESDAALDITAAAKPGRAPAVLEHHAAPAAPPATPKPPRTRAKGTTPPPAPYLPPLPAAHPLPPGPPPGPPPLPPRPAC